MLIESKNCSRYVLIGESDDGLFIQRHHFDIGTVQKSYDDISLMSVLTAFKKVFRIKKMDGIDIRQKLDEEKQ